LRAEQTNRLAAADRRINELQAQLLGRDSTMSELRAEQANRLAAADQRAQELQAQLSNRDSAMSELRAEQTNRLAAADRRIDELQAQLLARDSTTNKQRAELEALQRQHAEQAELHRAAQQEANELRTELARRDAELSDLTGTIERAERRIERQSNRLAKKKRRVASLRGEILVRDTRVSELAAALEASEQKNVQLTLTVSELEKLESRSSELSQRLAAEGRRNEELRSELAARDSELAARDSVLGGRDSELAARDSELSKLRAEVASARQDNSALREELSSTLESTRRQKQEWCDRLIAADQELENERRKHKALQEKSQRQRSRSQRQHERAALLKASVHSLTEEKENVEARIQAIEASRSWRAASRIARLRRWLTFERDARQSDSPAPSSGAESPRAPKGSDDSAFESDVTSLNRDKRPEPLPMPIERAASQVDSGSAVKESTAALEERLLNEEPADRLAELQKDRDRLQLENGELKKDMRTRFDELARLTQMLMEAEQHGSDHQRRLSASDSR